MRWDIFCQVIDNHGDAGVCWRLASELARRGDTVRLWIDDPAPLGFMAPQGQAGVTVMAWHADPPAPGDAVIEAFGCNPPEPFIARMAAAARPPAWINLEYLSAEPYVERSHGLPSPVFAGPGAGLTKHFFYPGFSPRTGGLLREHELPRCRAAFDRAAWLRQWQVDPAARVISLFCYEPAALPQLLGQLAADPQPTELLVTPGRAAAAVRAAGAPGGALRLHWMPLLSQREYDHLLWSCDLNFVRGEDSLVRGLLAGRPCVWQIYPQQDDAHRAKLEAFLAWLQPPADLARWFRGWNALQDAPLPPLAIADWHSLATRALAGVEALPELATELGRFARVHARI